MRRREVEVFLNENLISGVLPTEMGNLANLGECELSSVYEMLLGVS